MKEIYSADHVLSFWKISTIGDIYSESHDLLVPSYSCIRGFGDSLIC
ncbi:hypothetical protein [Psychroflexus halocasei]|nr:hypothetical protein [Psychroflexus halocasei]